MTLTRIESRKGGETGWSVAVRIPRDEWDGTLCRLRLKSVRTGAAAEFLEIARRQSNSDMVHIMVPKGTAGLEPGDMVAVAVTPLDIDIERWFDSEESVPLTGLEVRRGCPVWMAHRHPGH